MRFNALALLALAGVASALTPEPETPQLDEEPKDVDELKIDIIRKGTIPCERKTEWGDVLLANFKGEFTNGKLFDGSWNKEPLQFQLGPDGTIKGFQEGMIGVCLNEIRRITIPSRLAYGKEGAGNHMIPPDTALMFTVELLEILNYVPPWESEAVAAEEAASSAAAEASSSAAASIASKAAAAGVSEAANIVDAKHDEL